MARDFKIVDIVPSGNKKASLPHKEIKNDFAQDVYKTRNKAGRRFRKYMKSKRLYAIAFVSLGVIGFVIYIIFAHAIVITITPKVVIVEGAEESFLLETGGDIVPEVMKFSEEFSKVFTSNSKRDVSRFARGTVAIFNTYNSFAQVLVEGTRLETPDGKIFRTAKRVTVPGFQREGGRVIPGSVEVDVIADSSGEAYNIGLSDFTIPGLKGTPLFEKFYARSKTRLDGGFTGTEFFVSEQDAQEAEKILHEEVRVNLAVLAEDRMPPSFTILPTASVVEIETISLHPALNEMADSFTIHVRGTFSALIFDASDLEQAIAGRLLKDLEIQTSEAPLWHQGIHLIKNNEIRMEVMNKDFEKQRGQLNIVGNPSFIWTVDENELRDGVSKVKRVDELSSFLQQGNVLERATVRFRPSWWRKIPKSPDRVIIEIRG